MLEPEPCECGICLNTIDNGSELWVNASIPCECAAIYHKTCVEEWFRTSGKNECPICHTESTEPHAIIRDDRSETHDTILSLEFSCGTMCVCLMCFITVPMILTQMNYINFVLNFS